MYSETEDVIRALAENAESVCRAYLPAGRREGSYWIVGDLQNNPGRSLFVRLTGPASGPGAAGKFTDGATGEHGDLLDIIRERTGISRFPDLLAEARAHLGRPQPVLPDAPVPKKAKAPGGTPAAAARLFAASVPVAGTLADTYLRSRGLTQGGTMSALRFHPKCWHRDEGQTRSIPRPALIAAVTDGAGALQGVHRTWLAPDGQGKAAVETQRRAMGHLLGNAVRLTPHDDILVVGEGIETMLSLRRGSARPSRLGGALVGSPRGRPAAGGGAAPLHRHRPRSGGATRGREVERQSHRGRDCRSGAGTAARGFQR